MKISGTFFLVLLIQFSGVQNTYSQVPENINKLIADKKINSQRAWKKLLHIEKNVFGLAKSQITDPKFFLSNKNSYREMSEVEATLLSFQEPLKAYEKWIEPPIKRLIVPGQDKIIDHSQHPICRFPARLKFLKEQLHGVPDFWKSLPKPECVFQRIFLEALSPQSVSFVFSSYYADSPGSAFGHTFFRFNRFNHLGGRQELLDYGVGYAANVTVSNGALYALLGLVGGFTGTWTNVPYYYKVREYNDFESRDLWSYDLNLTPDEVQMLAYHMWEIGDHYYTYYFFTQNCAYHMLTALEAAAPRLSVSDKVPFLYVIPADSIKALFHEKNLVSNVSFRPSQRMVFLKRFDALSDSVKKSFVTYASGSNPENLELIKEFSAQDKALFLDAAIDLYDLRNPKIAIANDDEMLVVKDKLLLARSQVEVISEDLTFPIDQKERPDLSHGSSRLGLSAQFLDQQNTGYFEYRFALHDLLDEKHAMPRNSLLEFFDLKFKIKPNGLRFEEMNMFKVFNINPINFFEKKITWGLEIGAQNKVKYCDAQPESCHLWGALAKVGYAKDFFELSDSYLWLLATMNMRYGEQLKFRRDYLAPGLEFGTLLRHNNLGMLLTLAKEFPFGYEADEQLSIEARYYLKTNLQLGIQLQNNTSSILSYYNF
jgi:hypothetical protein